MTQMPTLADLVRQVILDSVAGARDPVRQIRDAERLAGELSRSGDEETAAQPQAGQPAGVIAVGPDARRALDGAVAEARGHAVGARHILLGLLRNPASRAGRALGSRGITKATAFGAVLAGDQLWERA